MSISASTKPVVVPKRNVLLILSWGPFAWFRPTRPLVRVGELRRQLAKEVGRLFDGDVVGLDFLITGTDIVPDLLTPLSELTHPPYRNVCLDVVGGARSQATASINSVGEHLLRRHLVEERFQSGVDQQLWRLIELRWPHAVVGIRTRSRACSEMALRLSLKKYPVAPPLVELWNAQTRTVIEAPHWTEPFIRFASEAYPRIADFSTSPFCENLLRISTAIASRAKSAEADAWDVTGDLTQVLARASGCFRTFVDTSIPSNDQHEAMPRRRASSLQVQIQHT